MKAIRPKNVTAQLHYKARGNPPASHPETAVGNFFPGLEFNFQNVWKRVLIGLELLEYGGQVIAVDEEEVQRSGGDITAPDGTPLRTMVSAFLETLDGVRMYEEVQGPPANPNIPAEQIYLEWSNALAQVHAEKGGTEQTVECFFVPARETRVGPFRLKVRRLIEPDTALISREASLPGEITESLCSPWQTDYIGCACYYWASNRPDYVNTVDVTVSQPGGASDVVTFGHNWLNLGRLTSRNLPFYTLREENLLQHADVMRDWENKFQFVIEGRDRPDGSAGESE